MNKLIKNIWLLLLFVVFGFSNAKAQQLNVASGGNASGTLIQHKIIKL